MSKTSLDPSKLFLGNVAHQENFIRNCASWYLEILGRDSFNYSYDQTRFLELLHIQYARGVLNGWLGCTYAEFERRVLGKPEERVEERYPLYRRWRRGCQGPYRVGTKYRKNPEHKPKEESDKSLWREWKGFDKDKRGKHWHNGSRTRIFWKNQQNRERRRATHRLLRSEKYEQIFDELTDRWRWD